MPSSRKQKQNQKVGKEKSSSNSKDIPSTTADQKPEVGKPADVAVASVSDSGESAKYSKRKIVSNWNQYEEPQIDLPEDSKETKDLEMQLNFCSDSSAHFKLQEEKEWEEEMTLTDTFSIDLATLANALECIPFHKGMGIPEKFLSPELISNFNEKAKRHKQTYKPIPKKATILPENFEEVLFGKVKSVTPASKSVKKSASEQDDQIANKMMSEPEIASLVKADMDKELDFLLSLPLPTTQDQAVDFQTFAAESKQGPSEQESLKQGLNVSDTKIEPFSLQSAAKESSLDDWLDSIVDS